MREPAIDPGLRSPPTGPIINTTTTAKPYNKNASENGHQNHDKIAELRRPEKQQHDPLSTADKWLYSPDLKGDLLGTPLPPRFVDETLTTAWRVHALRDPHLHEPGTVHGLCAPHRRHDRG